MKKCLIIINRMSGNGKKADEIKLEQTFGFGYQTDVFCITQAEVMPDLLEYDRIVACGGDGTLNKLVNKQVKKGVQVFYLPFGTLNEFAKGQNTKEIKDFGKAGDNKFAYVCACGIFTPIGYQTKNKHKQRFKALAYLANVLKQYKVHTIPATIEVNNEVLQEDFALIMAIDSPTCFGFKFNEMFKEGDGKMHLLTIKSPKRKGKRGKFKLFFPLFRAFFIGFGRPFKSKNMRFIPCEKFTMTLNQPTDFCLDGELKTLDGKIEVKIFQADQPVRVIPKDELEILFALNAHI